MAEIKRILIANRGEIARRLIASFREAGWETVSVFSEPDVDQPWVEEADYSAYLNGRTVAETYLDPNRIVAAAMDAGCDAIHPGYCFLAERVDFASLALGANLAVVGYDPRALGRANDRFLVRRAAMELGIPLVPASPPLAEGDDGVAAGAQLGVPLVVKPVAGGILRRVESLSDLPAAVAAVRDAAAVINGERTVYLERAIGRMRRIGTTVVADAHGKVIHLGETDSTLQLGQRTWIEEMGEAVTGPDLHRRLGEAAVGLARAIQWLGVARVRWAVTPDGGYYLLGFSGRLTTGYDLVEAVQGVDLIQTQLLTQMGEKLPWEQGDAALARHGVQLRVMPLDPAAPESGPYGTIEKLVLPEGENVKAVTGTAVGQPVNDDTDPLLVKITATGPTRHSAIVRARAALDDLVIEGVTTNLSALRTVLGAEAVWRREVDDGTVAALLHDPS